MPPIVLTTPRRYRRPGLHGPDDVVTAATPELSPIGHPWNNQQTTATPSRDPIAYVSPQAAVSVGLDPQTVYKRWHDYLATFPSAEAAIEAGIPAGVVRDLWSGGREPSWLEGKMLGIPNGIWVLAGLGAAAYAIARAEGEL